MAEGTSLTSYYPASDGFIGEAESTTLEPGTIVDRYGEENGRFVSPAGTPAEMRSLPPGSLDRPYNAYRVTNSINVMSGRISPAFDQIGLGIQHVLPDSVGNLVDQGFLERIP